MSEILEALLDLVADAAELAWIASTKKVKNRFFKKKDKLPEGDAVQGDHPFPSPPPTWSNNVKW